MTRPLRPTVTTHAAAPQPSNISGQHFEPLLNDEQAASFLGGLHPKTVQRMARDGRLPAIRVGRFWRFRASALNRWVEVHSTGQSTRSFTPQEETC